MADALSLFDVPSEPALSAPLNISTAGHARRTDPRASHDGAAKVNLPKRCAEVLAGLAAAGRPICATDLWPFVPNQLPNAIARRCRDLLGKGLVAVDVNASPLLWSLTDAGRVAARGTE